MGRPTTSATPGNMSLPVIVALSLFLPLLFPTASPAEDVSISSKTFLRYYQREFAGGEKNRFAPLSEYLSGDASNLGGMPIAFHFYGWGRVDLSEQTGTGKQSGDLGSAYLEYLHPQGNGQAKLGRFFLTEGAAMETIDGAFIKLTTPVGIGVSAFGGSPVEQSIIDSTRPGSSIYGGRVFFVRGGYVELGASYLKENGTFEGKDRELYGGDFWLSVVGPVELSGQAKYNRSTRAMAQQRYAVRIVPAYRFDVSVGYESYSYKDLFQTALHPVFLAPTVDNTDKVRTVFGIVDWEVVPGLTLEVAAKDIRHDRDDPGNARRGEAGVRYAFNDKKDVVGLSAAAVTGDHAENEYNEFRGFATFSPSKARFALDVLTQRFKQAISGVDKTDQVVASAGYKVLPYLSVSGDLTYTKSPTFQKDYAGLLRADLELGMATGGKK